MRTRFSCLLASASLALWPTLSSAMPVHGSESGDLSLAGTSLGQKFLRIVVGYSFSVSGANFSSITLPVSLNGASSGPLHLRFGGHDLGLGIGDSYTFGPGVTTFHLVGIDPALGLDPDDPNAFPVSYLLTSGSTPDSGVTIEPILADFAPITTTPLPASLWLLLAASGGLAALRRRVKT